MRPGGDCPKIFHPRRDKFQNLVRDQDETKTRPRRDRDSLPSLPLTLGTPVAVAEFQGSGTQTNPLPAPYKHLYVNITILETPLPPDRKCQHFMGSPTCSTLTQNQPLSDDPSRF